MTSKQMFGDRKRTRPRPRSTWALTILSLLSERDMHPYEMRRVVEDVGNARTTDLRPGSLYHAMGSLQRAQLVEPVETIREGRLPPRTVYRMTRHGREYLLEWIREILSTPGHDMLLQALPVLTCLEPDDACVHLEKRMLRLENEMAALEDRMRSLDGALPRLRTLEHELSCARHRAELDWTCAVVEDIRTGELTWRVSRAVPDISRPPQASDRALEGGSAYVRLQPCV